MLSVVLANESPSKDHNTLTYKNYNKHNNYKNTIDTAIICYFKNIPEKTLIKQFLYIN